MSWVRFDRYLSRCPSEAGVYRIEWSHKAFWIAAIPFSPDWWEGPRCKSREEAEALLVAELAFRKQLDPPPKHAEGGSMWVIDVPVPGDP
jgi:hypothetical protein